MLLTLFSTEQMIEVNGIPARVWVGITDKDDAVQVVIARIALSATDDCACDVCARRRAQFEAEVKELLCMKTETEQPVRAKVHWAQKVVDAINAAQREPKP